MKHESKSLGDEWVHGFTYEGMTVRKGKETFVLTDELIITCREEKQVETQLTLFE